MSFTVADVAALVGGRVIGDPALQLEGISSLAEARPGDISFLANQAYAAVLAETKASAVLVAADQDCDAVQIVVDNPDYAFAQVVGKWGPQPRPVPVGVHPGATVGADVELGEDVRIGAHVVIGDGARIGDRTTIHPQVHVGSDTSLGKDCVLYPQVVIRERCRIDDRVILHSGVVIGADGFGYASLEGVHHKIPQVGIVHVESDVEVGANSTIDRARFGVTRIGAGTKIDNLVQIAHNVTIGPHCIIVAQSGIAGTTSLGRHVTIAGQSGLVGHLTIGDGAMVAAQSGVTKNLPDGAVVMGSPACDMKVHKEREIALRRLPRTNQSVKQLEKRVAELEELVRRLQEGGV